MAFGFRAWGLSRRGQRPDNQDAFAIDGETIAIEERVVARVVGERGEGVTFFVADGVGGSPGGRWAADKAVALSSTEPHPSDFRSLENKLAAVSTAIREGAPNGWRPATTICGIILNSKLSVAFNVGDSRVYGFVGDDILQLSSDHRSRTMDNAITRFLGGSRAQALPDVVDLQGSKWSAFLLCSDGFYEELQLNEMRLLTEVSPPDALLTLSEMALDRGTADNLTALFISLQAP